MHDCVVIGGGPAGLTAAIYLARFHLKVAVIDAGESRVASIPLTRNHAGFPDGITGPQLLSRMFKQASKFGAEIVSTRAHRLGRLDDEFVVQCERSSLAARTVLLATGVVNHRPPEIPDALHDEALARGFLRYCPICDGYEVTDKHIALLGTGDRGTNEALFLRTYSSDVTLIAPGIAHDLDNRQRAELASAAVRLLDGPVTEYSIAEAGLALTLPGSVETFDSLYPALGSSINSDLAKALGAACSDEGCVLVDAHMRTDVPGLYAAGDVVKGLDQISHAMGEGGVAATAIRNDLALRHPAYRR